MAETSDQKPIQIRVIGIYIIIILALLRFLIFPLRGAIQEKKVVLGEQQETYSLKYQAFERQREIQNDKAGVEKGALPLQLYDKGTSNSYIYSMVLEQVTRLAEGKGLAVFSLEMLEPVAGKNISEIPVVIRLKGQPGPFLETLDTLRKSEKLLSIRSMEITKTGQDQLFSLTISAFRVEL